MSGAQPNGSAPADFQGNLQSLLTQLLPSLGSDAAGPSTSSGADPKTLQSLLGGNPAIADLLVQSLNLAAPGASGPQGQALGSQSMVTGGGLASGGSANSAASQALASVAASLGMDQTQLLSAALAGATSHRPEAGQAPPASLGALQHGSLADPAQGSANAGQGGSRSVGKDGDTDMVGTGPLGGAGGSPANTHGRSSSESPGPSSNDDAAVVNVKIPQLRAAHGQPGAAVPQVVYNASAGQSASMTVADGPDGPQGMSKNKIREKNRQAQRRFRERQRTLIKELRVQVELLCKTVKDQQSDLDRLQHENRLMKVLLQTFAKANQGGAQ